MHAATTGRKVHADYAGSGAQIRRSIWRKAAALQRAERARVLCDPRLPADRLSLRLVWRRLEQRITQHIRTAEDCQ